MDTRIADLYYVNQTNQKLAKIMSNLFLEANRKESLIEIEDCLQDADVTYTKEGSFTLSLPLPKNTGRQEFIDYLTDILEDEGVEDHKFWFLNSL